MATHHGGVGWLFISLICIISLLSLMPSSVAADDLYCGDADCYAVLDVTKTATPQEIKQTYRRLAVIWHPDKNKEAGAHEKFVAIATAYEVLSDEKTRKEYDDMLANPNQYARNYYNYARYRYNAGHTPLWKVLVSFLVFCTACHYLYWWSRFLLIRRHVLQNPKVQARMRANAKAKAVELAEAEGGSKQDLRGQVDSLMAADDVTKYVEVTGWQGRPPTWKDLLIFWIFWSPLKIHDFFYFHIRWLVLYTIMKKPYGDEEEAYLTRRTLGISDGQWDVVPDDQRVMLVSKQLWIPEKMAAYRKEVISGLKNKRKLYKR